MDGLPTPVKTMSAFPLFKPGAYPPRQWGLVGFPNVGKSHFLTQMKQPLLVIDGDGRFDEAAKYCAETPLSISKDPSVCRDPLAIYKALKDADLQGVGTIVMDSISPILRAANAATMISSDRGEIKNRSAPNAIKASLVRLIQDSVVQPGVDACIVWHKETGRDASGREQVTQTVSRVDGARMVRSLNAIIELSMSGGRRQATVVWSRVGKKNIVVPDSQGWWKGVPEQIEQALYGAINTDMAGGQAS